MLLPFYFWLILSYIKPALYDKEIKLLDKIYNISMLSIGLFLTGMSFGVIVIFQYILPYLMRFNNDMNYQLLYQSNIMIMFIFLSVIYSGLIFQTPIINYSLLKYKIIKLENLPLIRIFVLLGSMILGAVITPPDVLSQVIFTVPIYILFEVSTLIFKLNNKGGINK
jgi:sec-independent protein translocase protein TatC